jgi:hypothetical protein
LNLLTQSSDVRDCAGICVARVFSQQFVGLERNSELLLQDMQQHKVDLKLSEMDPPEPNNKNRSLPSSLPVTRVAPMVARRVVHLVAQLLGHLGLQRTLENGFGQLFQRTVFPDDILGLLLVSQQLIDRSISFLSMPWVLILLFPWPFTVLFTPSPRARRPASD